MSRAKPKPVDQYNNLLKQGYWDMINAGKITQDDPPDLPQYVLLKNELWTSSLIENEARTRCDVLKCATSDKLYSLGLEPLLSEKGKGLPNLNQYIKGGLNHKRFWYIMKWHAAGTVEDHNLEMGYKMRTRPVPLHSAKIFIRDVATAVMATPLADSMTRDLKPEHVAITKDGSHEVLDFGVERLSATGNTELYGCWPHILRRTAELVNVGTMTFEYCGLPWTEKQYCLLRELKKKNRRVRMKDLYGSFGKVLMKSRYAPVFHLALICINECADRIPEGIEALDIRPLDERNHKEDMITYFHRRKPKDLGIWAMLSGVPEESVLLHVVMDKIGMIPGDMIKRLEKRDLFDNKKVMMPFYAKLDSALEALKEAKEAEEEEEEIEEENDEEEEEEKKGSKGKKAALADKADAKVEKAEKSENAIKLEKSGKREKREETERPAAKKHQKVEKNRNTTTVSEDVSNEEDEEGTAEKALAKVEKAKKSENASKLAPETLPTARPKRRHEDMGPLLETEDKKRPKREKKEPSANSKENKKKPALQAPETATPQSFFLNSRKVLHSEEGVKLLRKLADRYVLGGKSGQAPKMSEGLADQWDVHLGLPWTAAKNESVRKYEAGLRAMFRITKLAAAQASGDKGLIKQVNAVYPKGTLQEDGVFNTMKQMLGRFVDVVPGEFDSFGKKDLKMTDVDESEDGEETEAAEEKVAKKKTQTKKAVKKVD